MGDDPFSDSAAVNDNDRDMILESTLAVGRNASLTLGADNLIVLDEGFQDTITSRCCGLITQRSKPTRSIPYFNILSVKLTKVDITICYAQPTSSKKHSPLAITRFTYDIQSPFELAQKWTTRLLDCAYGLAQRNKKIKVLINPYGGAGKASQQYYKKVAPIFEAAGCVVDVERTQHIGHAAEIAEHLDIDEFDVIACASGDGVPMECFNGLAQKVNATEALRKIAIAQLPCGSGNGMSWNLNGTSECSQAALCIVKGLRSPIDLASITQGNKRTLSFLSQSLGLVAESDLGTDNLRWMGDFRFTYGILVRLLGKTLYPIDIAVKTEIEDKLEIKRHYARERVRIMQQDTKSDLPLQQATASSTTLQGLPPLQYGSVNDPLPTNYESGWTELQAYPNLGNFYCGNMCIMTADAPFFPASLPNDGMLDLVTIDGDIGRLKALQLLLAVADGTFFDQDVVRIRKISGVRVIPKFGGNTNDNSSAKRKFARRFRSKASEGHQKKGYFSVDGESLPFEPFQIEIHRGLGTVLSRRSQLYEHDGPNGWEALTDVDLERPDITRF